MTTTPKEFAERLREVAAWYEEHPDVPAPSFDHFDVFVNSRAEFADLARKIGKADKLSAGGWFYLRAPIGALAVEFNIRRTEVCTPRVVGKRVVAAQAAIPEHTEDVVEWECHSLLDEDAAPPNVGQAHADAAAPDPQGASNPTPLAGFALNLPPELP